MYAHEGDLMKKVICIALFATVFPKIALSQLLTEEAVRSIERLANVICISLENSGASSSVSIDADAAAEAKAILRILGGVVGSIDIDAFISKYQNVSQYQLADLLNSAQDCRLEVFRSSREQIANSFSTLSPQQDKLIWNFPHVVRDGLALGVINAKPHGGSGVDVNYRLRNVRDEVIYVKFAGMSYTDETGNICQKGSFATGATGIAFRESDPPTQLPPGDSIQFSGDNIRCDGNGFGNTGDILATISVGQNSRTAVQVRFEISGIKVLND